MNKRDPFIQRVAEQARKDTQRQKNPAAPTNYGNGQVGALTPDNTPPQATAPRRAK